MIHTEANESDYKSFLIQCDCQDLGHVARLSYFLEKDMMGKLRLDEVCLELMPNPFLPWHKRLWLACKYIINPRLNMRHSYYDSIVLNMSDVKSLSNIFFCIYEEAAAFSAKTTIGPKGN